MKKKRGRKLRRTSQDIPELGEAFFAQARPVAEAMPDLAAHAIARRNPGGRPKSDSPKEHVSLRLDSNVLSAYKSTGKGWQSLVGSMLAKTVRRDRSGKFVVKQEALREAKKARQ
jgi:uncharacterized protein (DUF4415 family)